MTKSSSSASSDTPISSRKEDKFGRANFAKNLAKSIAGVPAEDGFVFALNAPWGSGKTSTLNMVKEALQKVNDEKKIIIVNFNPWWFSSGDSLVHDFFGQFNGALLKQEKGIGKIPPELIKSLTDHVCTLSSMLAPVASVLSLEPSMAIGLTAIKGMAAGTKQLLASSENIHQIRQKIDKLLKEIGNSGLRVLVVMDDLDRIQPNEMREMFRLVRGVADFPNTIYLLSFDRDAVVDAITDNPDNRKRAEKYLEKIVQMSMDLPPVNKGVLYDYFQGELMSILNPIQPDARNPNQPGAWNANYWERVFRNNASRFLQTPRDAKRWLNNVGASYPPLRGEVNPMDFAAIQAVRTFTPVVYREVEENKKLFVEEKNQDIAEIFAGVDGRQEDYLRNQADMLVDRIFSPYLPKGREIFAERVLATIFPFWNSHFRPPKGNFKLGAGNIANTIIRSADIASGGAYQNNLARHPDIFDKYFYLSLPIGDFSNHDMERNIALAATPEKFAKMLLALATQNMPGNQRTRLRVFLDHLGERHQDKNVLQHAEGILCAFFMIGDREEIFQPWLFVGNGMRYIAYNVLHNIEKEKERFRICQKSFGQGEAIREMWEFVFMLKNDLKKHSRKAIDRPALNEKHFNALRGIAVDKLKTLAEKGDVWNWRDPLWLLYRLEQEVSKKARRNCVQHAISTPEGFVNFCAQIGVDEQIKEVAHLADMNHQELINRAEDILHSEPTLDKIQQETLHQLVRWLKKRMPRDK